jgi:hypothetical protein
MVPDGSRMVAGFVVLLLPWTHGVVPEAQERLVMPRASMTAPNVPEGKEINAAKILPHRSLLGEPVNTLASTKADEPTLEDGVLYTALFPTLCPATRTGKIEHQPRRTNIVPRNARLSAKFLVVLILILLHATR